MFDEIQGAWVRYAGHKTATGRPVWFRTHTEGPWSVASWPWNSAGQVRSGGWIKVDGRWIHEDDASKSCGTCGATKADPCLVIGQCQRPAR